MIFDVGRSFPVRRSTLIVLINTLVQLQFLSHSTNRASSFIVPSPFVVHPFATSPSLYKSSVTTTLHASSKGGDSSPPPLPDTDDPYLILGLSTPTADKKQIKRAYKRLALRYHPDVRIGPDSTPAEKKAANDDFTRINVAYEALSGKGGGSGGKSPSSSSASGRTSTTGRGGYSYTPPHRRSGAPPPPPRDSYSTSWEDFMPKYDDEDYDTDGDSFGAIFSDFIKGAASSASSSASKGGGILEDLVSFLEGNFGSSFGTGGESDDGDSEFANLLTYGTFDEVKNELDDADLLAKQLERKDETLAAELEDIMNRGEGGGSSRYLERMELDERKMEIEARRKVVKSYLAKANTRRVRLRERYVELRSQRSAGRGTSNVGNVSSSYSSYNTGSTSSTSSYSTSSTSSSSYSSSSSSSSSSSGGDEGKRPESKSDDSWKREGFGSSGRSRRGRRSGGNGPSSYSSAGSSSGASSRRTEPSPSSSSSYSAGRSTTTGSQRVSTSTRTTTGRSSASSSSSSSSSRTNAGGSSNNKVPPHRRLTTDYISPEEEKRRLREIKVDEAIDQMKKELGL